MQITKNLKVLPTNNSVQPVESGEGGLNIGKILEALRRRAWLIGGITALVTLISGIRAAQDRSTFSSQFEILVQPSTAEAEVIASLPGTLTSGERPNNAVGRAVTPDLTRILNSPRLLLPVVKEIQERYPSACSNPRAAASVAANDVTAVANSACYRQLTAKLVLTATKDSNILNIYYEHPDPQVVQAFLDLTSKAYLAYSLESRQLDIRKGQEFVDNKLPDVQDQVRGLQDRLLELRQRYNLIDPETRNQQLAGQVGEFTQQQLDNRVQMAQTGTVSSDLQGQLSGGGSESAVSSALLQNPSYQAVMNRLIEVDAQIAQASTLFTEEIPDMQVLREERQNLLTLLEREGDRTVRQVGGQLQELSARDRALQSTLGSLRAQVNELSTVARDYANLQQQLEISTNTLNQLLAKREALEIDAAQRDIPWELLTPATTPRPTKDMTQSLVLGGLLGLLLGIGAALVVDRLADVIHSPEDLKRLSKSPLLGTIPVYNGAVQALVTNSLGTLPSFEGGDTPAIAPVKNGQNGRSRYYYETDPFSEAFRSLYANIRLLNTDSPIRSVVISSAMPAEGKSTIAIYLAQAAAAMGQRVLLVDTDLRSPHVHEYLRLPNTQGLLDILLGDVTLASAIQKTPLESNLFVLTTGTIPPDPTRLLSSLKMQHLMQQVQNNFDFIIYDTPPIVGFADAYLLASNTNGIVLVSQLGKLKSSQLEQAMDQIEVSNSLLLGMVARNSK
jgi:capsular exopolysaccharide synthesis family protein